MFVGGNDTWAWVSFEGLLDEVLHIKSGRSHKAMRKRIISGMDVSASVEGVMDPIADFESRSRVNMMCL